MTKVTKNNDLNNIYSELTNDLSDIDLEIFAKLVCIENKIDEILEEQSRREAKLKKMEAAFDLIISWANNEGR